MKTRVILCNMATWLVCLSPACFAEPPLDQSPADGRPTASESAPAVKPDAAGNVAIVDDEAHRISSALEPLFSRAGYGVTRVKWDELQPGRLSAAHVDLLVLADARRLPTSAVAATTAYLGSGGRLIALGAPAFGELLLKSPQGYVTKEHYAKALYDTLRKHPLKISSNGWTRACNDLKRSGKIESDGQGWKATVDLDAWDTFGQPLTEEFTEGRTLLCFRARGDTETRQLAVECTEKDQSRWIATVELTTDWRPMILRPVDFSFWPDSLAPRHRAGDRMEPANVASIHIGLSRTHSPQCLPGMHTFWFENLASASDPNPDQSEVSVPDIEGLCPSYKLYPVQGPLTVRRATEVAWLGRGEPVPGGPSTAASVHSSPGDGSLPKTEAADIAAYALAVRETGIGFDRHRACRWIRALEAYDASGRNRGAIAWLMLGEERLPGAIWANVGLPDPKALVADGPTSRLFQPVLLDMARTMTRGCFLLEGGSRYFSYRVGEPIELGALVGNSGHRGRSLAVSLKVTSTKGEVVFEKSTPLDVPAAQRKETSCTWTPLQDSAGQFPYTVAVQLLAEDRVIDRIAHRIDLLSDRKAGPEEFVRVQGSRFTLGGKPWHALGVNYWPNSQGGRPTVPYLQRAYYNPEQIERDLTWMEAAGINMLSGIQLLDFPNADAPGAFRDLEDFVERCRRHGMKLFCFLAWANPMSGADLEKIKRHIDAAGLKDHPAILAWDMAWEPIYYTGPAGGQMDLLLDDWNAWILDRYGSLDEAERDWGYKLPRSAAKTELAAMPDSQWCAQHGPWDRAIAAFRRFFSDRVGRAYGDLIRQLRRYDPNHLFTFRFGACGIPEGFRFAHAHSASVAKHVDFLCPEGYNLQTHGLTKVTAADDVRRGGLVTLYYRFLSREKPVVWMEFGYTVNGIHRKWKTANVRIARAELANQRVEYGSFYEMFLESGARGAAPWWLPGGFRLDEESDFGLLEPDGTARPACEVLRQSLPKFAEVSETSCVASGQDASTITLDLEAHYPDGWDFYSAQYLNAVKSGRVPRLRTEGTGTTSTNCPLVAVGNTPLSGHNPPMYLNAEFNSVEVKLGDAPWREAHRGEELAIHPGERLGSRASVGNIGEASWDVSGKPGEPGVVYLVCRLQPSGKTLELPLVAATPYLGDAEVREFTLPVTASRQTITLQMCVARTKADGSKLTIPFGERQELVVTIAP